MATVSRRVSPPNTIRLLIGDQARLAMDARIRTDLKFTQVGAGTWLLALSRCNSVWYEVRMIHKLITIAAWTLLAFIAYSTISPIQARPTTFASPIFERLAAFSSGYALLFSLSSTYRAREPARSWQCITA